MDQDYDAAEWASRVADRILRKRSSDGFASLSDSDSAFYCVFCFDMQVRNGGLLQFLYNSPLEAVRVTTKALDAVGAQSTSIILREALSLIGPAALELDQVAFEERLDDLSERSLDRLSELTDRFLDSGEDLPSLLLRQDPRTPSSPPNPGA